MKSLRVRIDTPCPADWNSMEPQSEGKFCGHCSKVVVDFTSQTDQEIIDYFEAYKGSRICGRFDSERVIIPPVSEKIYVVFLRNGLKYLTALLLPFMGFFLSSSTVNSPDGKALKERGSKDQAPQKRIISQSNSCKIMGEMVQIVDPKISDSTGYCPHRPVADSLKAITPPVKKVMGKPAIVGDWAPANK